ncbi:MAG: TPM domain-containing protein [Bacteroidia bacterium]
MDFKKIRFYILILISFTNCTYAQKNPNSNYTIPQPTGWVNDFEDIFSAHEIKTLDSIISNYEKKTTIEISIVTIDTNMVSDENFNDYVLQLSNEWGVGKKGKNNGVVIGFSSGYRKMQISNGYGIEKILSDEETAEIMNKEFFSYYKRGEFYEGTLNGLNALIEKLNQKLK